MTTPDATSRPGVTRFSAAIFLISLVAMLATAPLVRMCSFGELVEDVLTSIVLIMAVLAVGGGRRHLVVAICIIGPAITTRWVYHFSRDTLPHGAMAGTAMLAAGFIVAMLLRYILQARRVTTDVLCAAVANYLMLGLLWSTAYALIERLAPGSFICSGASSSSCAMDSFTFFYFSLVTLCTVGYGDISPVSDWARMLAVLEAITGTFYMTILIARLVAMYSMYAPARDREKAADKMISISTDSKE